MKAKRNELIANIVKSKHASISRNRLSKDTQRVTIGEESQSFVAKGSPP